MVKVSIFYDTGKMSCYTIRPIMITTVVLLSYQGDLVFVAFTMLWTFQSKNEVAQLFFKNRPRRRCQKFWADTKYDILINHWIPQNITSGLASITRVPQARV